MLVAITKMAVFEIGSEFSKLWMTRRKKPKEPQLVYLVELWMGRLGGGCMGREGEHKTPPSSSYRLTEANMFSRVTNFCISTKV